MYWELNGFRPANFTQRKLTGDEGSILKKAFWEMIFVSEDVLPVYGVLKTYIMMITNMKEFLTLDDSDNDAEFSYNYRKTMIAQFEHEIYNENFSLQNQSKCGENDTLKKRIDFWLNVIDMWGFNTWKCLWLWIKRRIGMFCSRCRDFSWDWRIKNLLDILKRNRLRKHLKNLCMIIIGEDRNRIMLPTKLLFIILLRFGV